MNLPLVSILVPTYNREDLISKTVESAIRQTYKNIEIIIVDNKSTDKTFEILRKYEKKDKRIRLFQNEENIGPVLNWKRCIELASGQYSKILWSDDLIADNFMEKTLPYLVEHEDVGFVYTSVYVFNEKEKILSCRLGVSGLYESSIFIKGILLQEKPFPVSLGCALFRTGDLRRSLVVDIPNKFNFDHRSFAIGNDLLIYLITAYNYPKFAFVEDPLAFFRWHHDSITIKTDKNTVLLGYNFAKTYFVENYLYKEKDLWFPTIEKFNALLKIDVLKSKFFSPNAKYNIKNVGDLYYQLSSIPIDNVYYIKELFLKSLRKILRKIVQNGKFKQ